MGNFSLADRSNGIFEEHSTLEGAEKALEEHFADNLEEQIESEMIMEDREAKTNHRSSCSEDRHEMEKRAMVSMKKFCWIVEN